MRDVQRLCSPPSAGPPALYDLERLSGLTAAVCIHQHMLCVSSVSLSGEVIGWTPRLEAAGYAGDAQPSSALWRCLVHRRQPTTPRRSFFRCYGYGEEEYYFHCRRNGPDLMTGLHLFLSQPCTTIFNCRNPAPLLPFDIVLCSSPSAGSVCVPTCSS